MVIRVRTYLHVRRYENDGIQERIFVQWRASKFGLQIEKDISRRSCSTWNKIRTDKIVYWEVIWKAGMLMGE